MRLHLVALLPLLLAACNSPSMSGGPPVPDGPIAWRSYTAGMAEAKAEGRPVLLVIGAVWCPHCRNYKKVFLDPKVASAAREFVMVRIDADAEPQVAARYALDGNYLPRTYFLAPDGTIADVRAENPNYRYFYDERNPASILAGMSAALKATHRAVPN